MNNKTQLQNELAVAQAQKNLVDFDKAKKIEIDALRAPLLQAVADARDAFETGKIEVTISDLQTKIATAEAQEVSVSTPVNML